VFVNIERPEGRLQLAQQRSDPLPVDAVPGEWRSSQGWLLAPVAAELPDEWATAPPDGALVAVGWQGLLRELVPGEPVRRIAPGPHPIIERADLAALSRDDVDRATPIPDLLGFVRQGATLIVTQGDQGGIVAQRVGERPRLRHYPPVPSPAIVDSTGAGDTFLAALTAARVEPRLVGGRIGAGYDLLMAAAAASLVLEGQGMLGVPDRAAIARRMAEGGARTHDAGTGSR
jgi:pfkB family carbohydrate kinase